MKTKTSYQIAAVQMGVEFAECRTNGARVLEHLTALARQQVDLAIFPECVLNGYCFGDAEAARAAALEPDAAELRELESACRDLRIGAVFGYIERDAEHLWNAAALYGPAGRIGCYRKVHLPCLGLDRFTTPGDRFEVFDLDGLRVGLLICYDSAFPEATRVLALAGADLIALPTNWPSSSGLSPDVLPSCRALENHVYFAAVNRIGDEGGFHFVGKSRISAPNGRNLAYADHDREELLLATVEPTIARNKHLVNIPGRHEIDRFADRRPELYRGVCAN